MGLRTALHDRDEHGLRGVLGWHARVYTPCIYIRVCTNAYTLHVHLPHGLFYLYKYIHVSVYVCTLVLCQPPIYIYVCLCVCVHVCPLSACVHVCPLSAPCFVCAKVLYVLEGGEVQLDVLLVWCVPFIGENSVLVRLVPKGSIPG